MIRAALLLSLLAAACGGPTPLPKGPPPEYEDEPATASPSAQPATTGSAAPVAPAP